MKGNNPKNPIVSATIVRCHNGIDGIPIFEPTKYHFAPPQETRRSSATELSDKDRAKMLAAEVKRGLRAARRLRGAR